MLVVLMFSCQKPKVNEAELGRYVSKENANGLYAETVESGYRFGLRYQPIELLALSALPEGYSKSEYEAALLAFAGSEHFVFAVSSEDGDTRRKAEAAWNDDYDSVYNDLLFNQTARFELRANGVAYPCSICHLENDGGARDAYTFVLGFQVPADEPLAGDRTVVYRDNTFTNTKIALTISGDAIDNIPNLSVKN
ncbi:MAG TPA: hypothetical protein VK364_10035 [Hymenobacter sp.]|nr:hypothetical protein [Hymenobacter sp.]